MRMALYATDVVKSGMSRTNAQKVEGMDVVSTRKGPTSLGVVIWEMNPPTRKKRKSPTYVSWRTKKYLPRSSTNKSRSLDNRLSPSDNPLSRDAELWAPNLDNRLSPLDNRLPRTAELRARSKIKGFSSYGRLGFVQNILHFISNIVDNKAKVESQIM
ncbi:unnamed protein product [Cuscuta campestris]|uniref:Uncharacterized protein n=1 Tax=Cuscuta campestris TaxID=132261 RepID=A0A484LMW2_9ASTE|nr:unnamed protein product [Cuscuta campestris]